MKTYKNIAINFRNGVVVNLNEWDDYNYDGIFFAIKLNGNAIAYYNCDDIMSFELY